jgi:hypothetical protein
MVVVSSVLLSAKICLAKRYCPHPRWFPFGDRRISLLMLSTVENTPIQRRFSWQQHRQRQLLAHDTSRNTGPGCCYILIIFFLSSCSVKILLSSQADGSFAQQWHIQPPYLGMPQHRNDFVQQIHHHSCIGCLRSF